MSRMFAFFLACFHEFKFRIALVCCHLYILYEGKHNRIWILLFNIRFMWRPNLNRAISFVHSINIGVYRRQRRKVWQILKLKVCANSFALGDFLTIVLVFRFRVVWASNFHSSCHFLKAERFRHVLISFLILMNMENLLRNINSYINQ